MRIRAWWGRRHTALMACCLSAAFCMSGWAQTVPWPTKTVRLIVGFPGGSTPDTAARALAELGISDIALCGLAKRLEEVWLPDNKDPIIFPRHSEGLYMLQKIRDEAHRFAITFHRSKRSKVMLESLLDDIPSLGDVRRSALLEKFGSVAALKKASIEEISAVPGIGERTAQTIVEALQAASRESLPGQIIDMQTGEILTQD